MADASSHAPDPLQVPGSIASRELADGTVLRPLSGREELEACVALQQRIWGEGFADVTSPAILKIAQEVGGVAAGAFSPRGDLQGFVFGITGIRDRRPLHWSHMLAVLPEAWGRDLGFHLKAYQRLLLLPLGVETMEWTYDPLVAKNAYLNLVRLGARPILYLRDCYGTGEDSALSAGIGTDRFVVEWRLRDERVERALAGEGAPAVAGIDAPVVNVREPDVPGVPAEPVVVVDPPAEAVVRVEVPADVQAVRRESLELASRWRASTRRAFESLLGRGHAVTGFERVPGPAAGTWRCFYVLRESSPR